MSLCATHLVVGRPKAPPDILVIKNLHFKAEVLLQVLDNHDQERQLDTQSLGRVSWTRDVSCAHVAAHDFKDARLNIAVSDSLDVTIPDCNTSDTQCDGAILVTSETPRLSCYGHAGRPPCLSQICNGLLPMLYKMDKNPDWKVFLNMMTR